MYLQQGQNKGQHQVSNGQSSEFLESSMGVVPLIWVSRWSPYPGAQTWGFRSSGPIPRAFPLHLITSVLGIMPLDITVMIDIKSTWIVQECPRSLLYSPAQPGNGLMCTWQT